MPRQRPSPINLLVVDDHRTFAEALGMAVATENGFEITLAFGAAEALDAAARRAPDVVLMDVEMPGVGGLEAIRKLKDLHPSARVIVLSAHEGDRVKGEALEAGAVAFVSKLTPLSELPVLVKRAHAGEPLMDREEVNRLLRQLRRRRHQESTERQRVNRLTKRHVEILQLMAQGVRGPELAERLGVTNATLRTHVQNILTRLGVHGKDEALLIAIRHGRISPSR